MRAAAVAVGPALVVLAVAVRLPALVDFLHGRLLRLGLLRVLLWLTRLVLLLWLLGVVDRKVLLLVVVGCGQQRRLLAVHRDLLLGLSLKLGLVVVLLLLLLLLPQRRLVLQLLLLKLVVMKVLLLLLMVKGRRGLGERQHCRSGSVVGRRGRGWRGGATLAQRLGPGVVLGLRLLVES